MGFVGDAIGAIGGFLGGAGGDIIKGAGSIIGGAMGRSAGGQGGGYQRPATYQDWQKQNQNPYQNVGSDLIRSAMMGRFGQSQTQSPTSHLLGLGRRYYG